MFTVVTPATNKRLTTVDNVKTDLGITGSAEDVKIGRLIDRISAMICNYIGVPAAADGSKTLGLETLAETFDESPWLRGCRRTVILSRRPVPSITSITIGGAVTATIEAGDYEIDGNTGILRRTHDVAVPGITYTPGARTIITYTAGWSLPPVANFTLPFDIEGAVINMIRSARFAADRDPTVKAEWTTDIERIEYWVGKIGENGAFPPDIASTLDPYCYEPMF